MKVYFRDILALLVLLALGLMASRPVWEEWSRIRIPEKDDDWDNQLLLAEAAREAVIRYAEPPLWNMYVEGGAPLLANPESAIAYPLTWLTLPLPTQSALKLQLLLHLGIGIAGVFVLCRRLGLSPMAAAYGAACFMFASTFPERMRTGHLMWMATAWMPWAVAAALRWTPFDRILLALLLAAQWLQGGHYVLLYTLAAVLWIRAFELLRGPTLVPAAVLLMVALVAAPYLPLALRPGLLLLPVAPLAVVRGRRIGAELGAIAVVLTLFMLVAAVKLIPTLELWSFSPRFSASEHLLPPDSGVWQSVARWAGWLARDSVEVHEDQPTFYHALPLVLAFVGCLWGRRELRALPLVLGLAWLWSLGRRAPLDISALMDSFPAFSVLRYPARSAVLVFLCIAVSAAFGVGWIERLIMRTPFRPLQYVGWTVLCAVLLASAGWMAVSSGDTYVGVYNSVTLPSRDWSRAFARERCTGPMYLAFLRNAGCIDGFTPVPLVNSRNVKARDSRDYRGEAYLEATAGQASIDLRSPNSVQVRLSADARGTLVLNQSYYPGWGVAEASGADAPLLATSWNGLLSVPIGSGQVTGITLKYGGTTPFLGAAVSAVTLSALLLHGLRRRKKP